MKPRIAIPVPHSEKEEYNQRALPRYLHAIEAAGGEPVVVPLRAPSEEIAALISTCQGALLPGSPADVDPQKYGAPRDPHTQTADPLRDNADELILQDAYNMHKPLFGVCYGLQSLNVWRSGSLAQHIQSPVEHEVKGGRPAHAVAIEKASRLGEILGAERVTVNSSHHQAADVAGDGLRVSARCPEDGVIEALEGTDAAHFVLAVQWHPERGSDEDPASQALFHGFIRAAREYRPRH
jgi:putative glutamine amidotransferase